MWYILWQVAWLRQHATRGEDGVWRCNISGEKIVSAATGRSIWIRQMNGGPGEVRQINHLWCPKCNPSTPPEYGTPIYEDEVIETH